MENTRQIDPTGILEGHAPSLHYTLSREDQELVGELDSRFREAQQARLQWERDANFYRIYVQGNQLVLRSRASNEILRATVYADNSKNLHSVDNKLRPINRACVGKLSRVIPTATVLPATDDTREQRAAMVAESLLKFHYRRLRLRSKWIRAMGQISGWAGTSIIELSWDPRGGREISWCGECKYTGHKDEAGMDCPACQLENEADAEQQNIERMQLYERMVAQQEMMGQPPSDPPPLAQPKEAPQLKAVNEGDVDVEVYDPRDFYPEPGVACIEDMRWYITRQAVAVSKLRKQFPEFARYIHSEDGISNDRTLGFYGFNHDTRSEQAMLRDHAYLYRFVELPSELYPKGRIIFKVNGMPVKITPCPYDILGRVPAYVFRYETNESEFWGETWVSQAWHIQKEANQLLSQMRAHREMTLYPQKLVPITARIGAREWSREAGKTILYNPMGGQPKQVEIPSYPNYVYNELGRMEGSMRDKAAVTEQEMGQSSGDPSGRYAAILEAQSSETLQPILTPIYDEWMDLLRGILLLCQEYYDGDRTWTVVGRERVKTYAWKEANLQPGWDLEMAEEDSLSRNPALRLQQAERLLQANVFLDQETGMQDMRAFKRVAGLKLPGSGPDLEASERAYASQIPDMLLAGEYPGPMPWDDTQICAEELLTWLRTSGRTAPRTLLEQVYGVWSIYMSFMQTTVPPLPETAGAETTSPNQPTAGGEQPTEGGMGAGAVPGRQQNPANEAAQIVRTADRQAERAATSGPHES